MIRVALLAVLAAIPLGASAAPVQPDRGLLASYRLDGGAAVDAVTGARAAVHGARAVDGHDGRPGGALWFDGQGAWVSLGTRLQPARFTVSAWIRPDAVDRPMAIVSKVRNLPGHYARNLELRLDPGGRLFAHVPGGNAWDAVQGARALAPGRWAHVALTYDGAHAQLWVDGARDGAPLAVAYAQSQTETGIGARPEAGGPDGRTAAGPSFFFRGAIDDVRVYDRALPDAEVALLARPAVAEPVPAPGPAYPPAPPQTTVPPPYRPPPGPVAVPPAHLGAERIAEYDLDGDARDATRRGPDGVVHGAGPAEDRAGNPAGALALGGRGWVDLGARVEPERFSIAMWIRPARLGREAALFSKWSAVSRPRDRWLELRIDRDGRVVLQTPTTDSADAVRTERTVDRARWTHVAATFDGQRGAVYLDGRLEAEGDLDPFDATRGPVFLGARPDARGRRAAAGFEGRLDEVSVWRGPLGPAEIAALAAAGRDGGADAGLDGDDDRHALVRMTRVLATFDAGCARRDAQLVARAEARAAEEVEAQLRDARGDRERVRRLEQARAALAAVRGRRDAESLDRTRDVLTGLCDDAWRDLVERLDDDPWTRPARYDDRRDGDWR